MFNTPGTKQSSDSSTWELDVANNGSIDGLNGLLGLFLCFSQSYEMDRGRDSGDLWQWHSLHGHNQHSTAHLGSGPHRLVPRHLADDASCVSGSWGLLTWERSRKCIWSCWQLISLPKTSVSLWSIASSLAEHHRKPAPMSATHCVTDHSD